jgi:Mrp family chromosome partitioning ATPase
MSNDIQMLAIWGNPCSGKTTTAVKLATELASHKKNVVILMCDFTSPAPQTLLPDVSTNGKSLGELLSLPSISQEEILRRCIPFGKNPYIACWDIKGATMLLLMPNTPKNGPLT